MQLEPGATVFALATGELVGTASTETDIPTMPRPKLYAMFPEGATKYYVVKPVEYRGTDALS